MKTRAPKSRCATHTFHQSPAFSPCLSPTSQSSSVQTVAPESRMLIELPLLANHLADIHPVVWLVPSFGRVLLCGALMIFPIQILFLHPRVVSRGGKHTLPMLNLKSLGLLHTHWKPCA